MKKLLFTFLIIVMCIFALAACDNGGEPEATTKAPEVTVEQPTQTEAHVCSFGEWTVVNAATCTESGWSERVCACGETQVLDIIALGHTEATVEAVEPTCTTSGLTESKYCSVCDEVLVEAEVIEATGHAVEDGGFCSGCDQPIAPSTCVVYGMSDDGKYAIVKGYTGTSKRVFIGDEYNGVAVCAIASHAFSGMGLTDIVVPESVVFVGEKAFEGCEAIYDTEGGLIYVDGILIGVSEETSAVVVREGTRAVADKAFSGTYHINAVTLPDSVLVLGNSAFESCNGLKAVHLGESSRLYYIGESCFRYLFSLTTFNVPDTVTTIGTNAFYCCEKLENIKIPSGLTSIAPYAFYSCLMITDLVIPEGVTAIGDGAFNSCKNLETVKIADSVETIGMAAFSSGNRNISALVGVTFGEGSKLRYIGSGAFSGNYALESIIIPAGVTCIESETFNNCSALASVTFRSDSTITYIGSRAFYYCAALKTIDIPKSVTSIGNEAFYSCDLIESLVIPASVESIGEYAFGSNYGSDKALASITFGEGSRLKRIEWGAFFMCGKVKNIKLPEGLEYIGVQAFNACTSLESIVIPSSVTTICDTAFWYCTSLKTVVISEGVTEIGTSAFLDCPELESVTIPTSVQLISSGAFMGCGKLASITYAGTMEQWGAIIIDIPEYTFESGVVIVCIDGTIEQ